MAIGQKSILPEKQKNPAIKTGFFLDSLIRHNSFIISYLLIISCFRNVKDKNFESDSQPMCNEFAEDLRCFRNVKDKNFESDSQLKKISLIAITVVSVTSKIRILKAIHNWCI